jgi:FKBP-type peptidyl-prolyl cis-trans isomerase FklB
MKSKIILLIAGFCITFLFSCEGQKAKNNQEVKLKTHMDSVTYAVGSLIGSNLKRDFPDSLNMEIFMAGINHVMHKDSVLINFKDANQMVQKYVMDNKAKAGEASKQIGTKFLEDNKKKPGIITTSSGLQYQIIKTGTGPKPTLKDTVACNYTGTLTDGTVFDSSDKAGKPVTFPVTGVIKGWTEALQLMPQGSKWKLYIPSDLGYGERGAGGQIGPNAVLIFDIELVTINGK